MGNMALLSLVDPNLHIASLRYQFVLKLEARLNGPNYNEPHIRNEILAPFRESVLGGRVDLRGDALRFSLHVRGIRRRVYVSVTFDGRLSHGSHGDSPWGEHCASLVRIAFAQFHPTWRARVGHQWVADASSGVVLRAMEAKDERKRTWETHHT